LHRIVTLNGKSSQFGHGGGIGVAQPLCTEPAAKGLKKKDALAAVKLYRALGLRIVNVGKSKYFSEALGHFENARDLLCATGNAAEWQALNQNLALADKRKEQHTPPKRLRGGHFHLEAAKDPREAG